MAENEVNNPLATESTSFDPRSTTDFEPRQVEAPKDFSTVKKPIAKDPVLLQGLADVFGNFRKSIEGTKGDSVLGEFQKKQLLIVDALETGDIKSSKEARLRLRRNLMEFSSSYPQYAKDLVNVHSKILGFSDVVDTGSDEERRRTKLVDKLTNEGLLAPDASESQIDAAIAHNQSRESRLQALESRQKELSVMLSEENLSSAQRSRLEDEQRDVWRTYVKEEAPDQVKRMRNQFDQILQSDISEADKEAQITDLMIGFRSQQEIIQLRRILGSEESEAFFKPFEMMEQTYLRRSKGELRDDELERELSRIENYNASILAADPNVQKVMGAKKLFGDSAILPMIVQNSGVMQSMYKVMTDNTTPVPANPYDPKNEGGFNQLLKELPDLLDRVEGDEELTEEVKEQVNGTLQGAADNEGSIRRDPIKARTLVENLASTKFYEKVVKREGIVDQEFASEAREALKLHYNDEVMGMVKREFQENNVIPEHLIKGGEGDLGNFTAGMKFDPSMQQPTPEAVGYRTTNSVMEFYPIDSGNALAVKKARELNKTLAPIIRNMVKADAHLSGHNRYQEVWESYADQVLSPDFLGQPAGGDEGDDLTLEAFERGSSKLNEAMASGGYVGDGDFSQAKTPEEVAAAFVGFNEKEEKDVLASFIKQTTGQNINPSTTAWCAAFVNGALGAKGVQGTGTFTAKDFLNWGKPVDTPKKGDIVVFDRGNPGDWQGHVGFYVGPSDKEGFIRVLGGNQDDTVSIKDFDLSRLEGFRRGT